MRFALVMLVILYPMRKAGWILSLLLYRINMVPMIIVLTLWGCGLGFAIGLLDWYMNPHWAVKVFFGVFEGAYLAQPNYGLIQSNTIPEHALDRHSVVTSYPRFLFIISFGIMLWLNTSYNYGSDIVPAWDLLEKDIIWDKK